MAAPNDEQRSVIRWHIVEMDADSHHPLEQALWWLSVRLPLLEGPGTEAFNFDALHNADCPILMPAERPIGL